MMNHYKNTISIVYLLFCLFITSASAHSYIRQFTDGGNTNLQQNNGAVPNSDMDKAYNLRNEQEISSRDYKVSVSSMLKGFRTRPPSSYSLEMDSFNPLYSDIRYVSQPFSAGGYNWTLVVYPNGNRQDGGADHLSLYVAIDKSTFVAPHQEVVVDLRFYIFNKKEKKYLTIQDTDVWTYNTQQTMWGFSQALPLNVFRDQTQGYRYDGEHSQFGVDVTLPPHFEKYELFSVTKQNQKFTWRLQGFSKMLKYVYTSDSFTIGGISWDLKLYPSGYASGEEGVSLHLFFNGVPKKLRPYQKIYTLFKFRAINQRQLPNIENQIEVYFSNDNYGWGSNKFLSFADVKDSSKGFVVNDVLIVEVEIVDLSSTTYFP